MCVYTCVRVLGWGGDMCSVTYVCWGGEVKCVVVYVCWGGEGICVVLRMCVGVGK